MPPRFRGEDSASVAEESSMAVDEKSSMAVDEEPERDFTNEEVQEWLHTDGGVEQLEEWVEDDLARLISDGEMESHYAVLDPWWGELAKDLGFEEPSEEEFTEFIVDVALTSAYQDHDDRVGEYPDIGGGIGTSPFVVEHQFERTDNDLLDERTESKLIDN